MAFVGTPAWNLHTTETKLTLTSSRYGLSSRVGSRSYRVYALTVDSTSSSTSKRPGKPDRYRVSADVGRELIRHASLPQQTENQLLATSIDGLVDLMIANFPSEEFIAVFLFCGNGFVGRVGLGLAQRLLQHGYHVGIFHGSASLQSVREERETQRMLRGCQELGMMIMDTIPSTLDAYFDVYIDALVGIDEIEGDEVVASMVDGLDNSTRPMISIDMPSGWDPDSGPAEWARRADAFIKPDILVSLGVPKLGSKMFAGMFHYLVGRLPDDSNRALDDIGITRYVIEEGETYTLVSHNPFRSEFGKRTGEVYGSPGQYMATLFTKNPRRVWVDVEEDEELWDELD